MNSGSQHKMYGYEVTPPPAVWEKIAVELDESGLQFPSKLHLMEVIPPVYAWQNIAATLDELALVNDYAGRLAGIEVDPPATAWNTIKTSLDAEHEAAVPEHRRFSPLLKYAAAAVIIGLLAWGGIQLFSKQTDATVVSKQNPIQSIKSPETISPVLTITAADENMAVTDIAASLEEARNDAALEQSKKTYAKLDVPVMRGKIKNVADFFFVADDYEPTGTRGFSIEPPESPSIDISNRYIMLMTPDGNIIRMSKKLGNIICCVSGEEQDKDCIDQMKKWREKIASPSANHSSGNVLDILSLLNSMQDN